METRTAQTTASAGELSVAGVAPISNQENGKNKFRYTPPKGRRNDLVSGFEEYDSRVPNCHPSFAMTGPGELQPECPYALASILSGIAKVRAAAWRWHISGALATCSLDQVFSIHESSSLGLP